MSHLEDYENAHKSFRSGSVISESNEILIKHLYGLSNQNNINEGTQHRDMIRGITINHILMQRHIDSLNKQNSKTQKWVITLALAALISTVVQTTIAIRSELRAESQMQPNLIKQKKTVPIKVQPAPGLPQKTNPALKKAP